MRGSRICAIARAAPCRATSDSLSTFYIASSSAVLDTRADWLARREGQLGAGKCLPGSGGSHGAGERNKAERGSRKARRCDRARLHGFSEADTAIMRGMRGALLFAPKTTSGIVRPHRELSQFARVVDKVFPRLRAALVAICQTISRPSYTRSMKHILSRLRVLMPDPSRADPEKADICPLAVARRSQMAGHGME